MNLLEWDHRYRSGERAGDRRTGPTLLVEEWARWLGPGRALDLACGLGRNALYLNGLGWRVTAVDGAPAAIEAVRGYGLGIDAVVADLERGDWRIGRECWDLIVTSYYLQRGLFPSIREGVRPGGVVVAIVHIPGAGEEVSPKRAGVGELRGFFADWEVLHDYEGPSRDPLHRKPVAEVVARKPVNSLIPGFGSTP